MSEEDRENLIKCNDVYNALRYYIEIVDNLQKENKKLKENSISKDKIREKRNDLINEYFTKFIDNKDIYLAIDIIDEILNDSEVI